MSSFTFFLVCFQALLVQNVFCQLANYGPGFNGLPNRAFGVNAVAGGLGINGLGNVGNPGLVNGLGFAPGVPNVAASASVPVTGPFTSTGNAELAVGGEFGVSGTTVVGGQVPVIGAVSFTGQIPATGVVSIAGNCGCANVPL